MRDNTVTVVVASVTSCSAIVIIIIILCVCAFCCNKKTHKTPTSSHEVLSRPRSPFILPEKLGTLDAYFESYEIDETRLFVTRVSTLDIKFGKVKQTDREKNLKNKSNGIIEEYCIENEKDCTTKDDILVASVEQKLNSEPNDMVENNSLKSLEENTDKVSEVLTERTNQTDIIDKSETGSETIINIECDEPCKRDKLESLETTTNACKAIEIESQNDNISEDFDEIISIQDETHNERFEHEGGSRASTEHEEAFDAIKDSENDKNKDIVDDRSSRLQFLENILSENTTEETHIHEQPKKRKKQRRKELHMKQFEIGLFRYYLIRVQKRARKLSRKNLKVSPYNTTNHSVRPKSPLRQRGVSYPRPESRMSDTLTGTHKKSKVDTDVSKTGKYICDVDGRNIHVVGKNTRSRSNCRVGCYSKPTSRSVSMKDIKIGQYEYI